MDIDYSILGGMVAVYAFIGTVAYAVKASRGVRGRLGDAIAATAPAKAIARVCSATYRIGRAVGAMNPLFLLGVSVLWIVASASGDAERRHQETLRAINRRDNGGDLDDWY